MSRSYQFNIEIKFINSEKAKSILDADVSYPLSKNYKDHFVISNKSIKIEAFRSRKIDLDSIFFNYTSALNKQITKALSYFYCASGDAKKIRSIEVTRLLNGGIQDRKLIKISELNQVVEKNSHLISLIKLNKTELKTLLEESEKGHSILIATTHLVRACSLDNPFDQFDRLWKSFNAIYKEKTQCIRDADCLIALRTHMANNQHLYPLSTSEVSALSARDIRSKIRWRKMLLNDFPTIKQAAELKGFIKRITDSRLIEIIDESLSVRADHLIAENYYQEVRLHIESQKANNSKSDIDVLAVLCLRYMYFVRNKTVHAEKLDSAFNLTPNSKEELELAWCSKILKMLIVDLINFNSQF